MGKKVTVIFAGLVVAVFAAFLGVEEADAFCVYNKTDVRMDVVQSSGGIGDLTGFGKTIEPGGSACCHWTNKSCNTGGKRESTVKFDVALHSVGRGFIYPCTNIPIKAGGWLEVEGKDGQYKCTAYFEP